MMFLVRGCVVLGLALCAMSAYAQPPTVTIGQFVPTADMPMNDGRAAAAVLPDGRVLILEYTNTRIYDPAADTYSIIPTSSIRPSPVATALDTGEVLVMGLHDGGAELFEPDAGSFTTLAPIHPRVQPILARLHDGRVLVASGTKPNSFGNVIQQAEIYDPVTRAFSTTGSMTVPRFNPNAVTLSDGRVLLIAGGVPTGEPGMFLLIKDIEVYSPATGQFQALAARVKYDRWNAASLLLDDGRVMVTGGIGTDPMFPGRMINASTELYSPDTDTFSPTIFMRSTRVHHKLLKLADGSVLATGGDTQYSWTSSWAELFVPEQLRWIDVSDRMTLPRQQHQAVLLNDQRIMLIGGINEDGPLPWSDILLLDKIFRSGLE